MSIGHSYCIIEPIEIVFGDNQYKRLRLSVDEKIDSKKSIKLLKMRNPWGDDSWNGKWSRLSNNWNILTKKLRTKLLNDINKTQGMFYIQFEDFMAYFDELYFVHTNLNAFHRSCHDFHKLKITWNTNSFYGSWDSTTNNSGGL